MTLRKENALRIVHISDTHLAGDGSLHYGVVDTRENLVRVLERAAAVGSCDLVALSGDLSEDGSIASYEELRGLIEPWASDRGAVVAYAMGNHDNRENFESVLGSRTGSQSVRGFRVIRLDSSVPSQGYGDIDESQLAWLRAELATPSHNGSVLIVHHPPIGASSALLAALELQNPAQLIDACSGGDVRAILSGHYHCATSAYMAGVAVFVASGVANTSDPIAQDGTERAMRSSGFSVVDIAADGSARANFIHVPGPDDGEQIFLLDKSEVEEVIKRFGPH